MKRFLQISGMTLLIMLFTDLRNNANAQPAGDVSYQTFYDELSPYGRWIDYPEYGYVWCPDEGADFRPYETNGHWVWSDDYEWMWVSDYSWGWAPFHYGRWFYDDMYGWMWTPGYEWSPAWVAWRSGGDYYGWAPLRPGIDISFGFSINSYSPPINYWSFAPCRYITSPRIYDYCVGYGQNINIINRTTIINNYNYNRNVFVTGPRRIDAEHFTNERITPVRVRDMARPGRTNFRNNEVSIYRPSVQRNNNSGFEPRRVDQYRGNNNAVVRNDNRADRRNVFNDQRERNNNARFDNTNAERRNMINNDRVNRDNNTNNNPRGIRDVFRNDNRPGIDQPVQRNRFERQQQPARNDNFNRRDVPANNNNRSFSNNTPVRQERQDMFNNRNNNQQQQRQSFPQMNQRQEQPRQFQQQRQVQQPRQFSQPTRDNNNNNRGGNNHGRRG